MTGAPDLNSESDKNALRSLPGAAARILRLLVVSSDTYPPARVDVSILFGEELAGRGHRIDWILQSEQACAAPYVTNWGSGKVWVGSTDLGNSLFHRVHKHIRGLVHDLKLFGRLHSGDYDIIEVKDKFLSGIFALLAARMYRKRFVYWLSYPFPEEYLLRARDGTARYPWLYVIRGNTFRLLLYRLLLPAADHVFVQSEQMRRDIAAEGIPLERMTAVPMGIKPESFSAVAENAARQLMPPGIPCFLYLGTLAKVRRLDFLVRVLAEVRKQVPLARLYIVGRGDVLSDEQVLIDEAQRLNVTDAMVMVGQLPHLAALRYVQEADVCVSPFFTTPVLNSTSPTKLVEYMAMGKPVVVNDHPEQRLVVEQSGAGYCVPYEESAFAQAVVKLMNAPGVARDMGVKGRLYAMAHRAYGTIADQVESEFLRIAGAAEKK